MEISHFVQWETFEMLIAVDSPVLFHCSQQLRACSELAKITGMSAATCVSKVSY